MIERLSLLWPEIVLFATTCIVMVVGLSHNPGVRRGVPFLAGVGLLAAALLGLNGPTGGGLLPYMMPYAKGIIGGVGLLLLMLLAGTVDREDEERIDRGEMAFNPLRSNIAEFYAFFLFSLTGLMLCATANDLVWLFLALELTSLPTYIMVTISTRRARSQEAGVKYFFLGALGAAIFLYGFAMLYGGTGTTRLWGDAQTPGIAEIFASGGMNSIALLGILLSIVGIAFKIAAVPMHFYTADVYQGAASPVSAFLAFVPKTAGFIALILILATVGWNAGPHGDALPDSIRLVLWIMAAMTMFVGNVLAVIQSNVKRMLAYSSVAHSGYMLVGLIAGPGDSFTSSGIAAVLFYLFSYGVTNVGAFAVIAALERRTSDGATEVESIEDLRGLCRTRPILGWTMVLSALSLLGMPPILGFFAKVPLFTSAIGAGEVPLVVILGLNSAIAAVYYLRLVAVPLLNAPDPNAPELHRHPGQGRLLAGAIASVCVVAFAVFADGIMQRSELAARFRAPEGVEAHGEEHHTSAMTEADEHDDDH